jgi:hypothetical protein
VVVELLGLGGKPWVLAIDRTNWDFGKTTINILMISVTWNGMGIPLLWMLLPTAGNSSPPNSATSQQKDLSASKINKSNFDVDQSMPTTLVLDTFFDAVGWLRLLDK